jgi:predicted nucleic acid-binding Zn ribbon protein
MTDIVDRAQDCEETARAAAIKNLSRTPRLLPTGSCYYCGSPVRSNMLFCDAECRDDWEAERAARQRNGHGPV